MITLSAYTDVNTFVPVCESPNEPPQAHKEENEHDDFAEMLAGLLNKTAEGQTSLDEQAALDKQAAFGEQAAMKIDKTDESQVSGLNGEDAATFISETNNSEEIKNGKIFAESDSPETTEKKPAQARTLIFRRKKKFR